MSEDTPKHGMGEPQFNREEIPERIVHAKGGDAFGTFTVTNDEISEVTR